MRHHWVLAVMVTIMASPPPSWAQATTPAIATAKLVAEKSALVPGQPLRVALVLTTPDRWHTYWRNPGDSGAATTLDWRLPHGFSAGPLRWPAPERFVTGPIVSYGHGGEAWLISTLGVPTHLKAGDTVALAATAEWLACADICVPERVDVSLSLPVARAGESLAISRAFAAAERRLPRPLPGVSHRVEGGDAVITMPGVESGGTGRAWFFPHEDGVIDDAGQQRAEARGKDLVLRVPLATAGDAAPPRLDGVIVTGGDAFEIETAPRLPPSTP